METKQCSKCNTVKDLTEFHTFKSYKGKTYFKSWCKCCHKEHKRISQTANKSLKRHEYNLKSRFNMTVEQYDQMLKDQNYVCKICGKPETTKSTAKCGRVQRLAVDHDHKTGKVRGLLCQSCNVGLGKFKDDYNILLRAANYKKENS